MQPIQAALTCRSSRIEYYQLTAQLAGEIIATVGWPMMVTGQSLVLYSRLGVVLGPSHANVLKAVKWMIIIDAIVFHVSTTVVMFGAYNARDDQPFQQAYKYVEKVQMTAFTIQEFVLSGLYVWRTLDILNASTNPRRKRIMRELLSINIFIIIMDIALLVVEYQDRHPMEQAIKVVVYSIKLKFEFAILSKLVSIFERGDDAGADMFDEYERRQEIAKPEVKLVQQTARRDSKMAVKSEDEGALHIERASSWFSGTTYLDDNGSAIQPQLPKETLDLQRRRRTLEDDFYASALRDVSG